MALRQTSRSLAASKLNTLNLFHQINPKPLRGWRAHYADKLKPDMEVAKAELHKYNAYMFGADYGKVTENNFPYPLFWGFMLWFPMLVLSVYPNMGDERTNSPFHVWNPKNADGTTQFPVEPKNPNSCFQFEIKERAH